MPRLLSREGMRRIPEIIGKALTQNGATLLFTHYKVAGYRKRGAGYTWKGKAISLGKCGHKVERVKKGSEVDGMRGGRHDARRNGLLKGEDERSKDWARTNDIQRDPLWTEPWTVGATAARGRVVEYAA